MCESWTSRDYYFFQPAHSDQACSEDVSEQVTSSQVVKVLDYLEVPAPLGNRDFHLGVYSALPKKVGRCILKMFLPEVYTAFFRGGVKPSVQVLVSISIQLLFLGYFISYPTGGFSHREKKSLADTHPKRHWFAGLIHSLRNNCCHSHFSHTKSEGGTHSIVLTLMLGMHCVHKELTYLPCHSRGVFWKTFEGWVSPSLIPRLVALMASFPG